MRQSATPPGARSVSRPRAGSPCSSARSAIGARDSTPCSTRGARCAAARSGTSISSSRAQARSSRPGRRARLASCLEGRVRFLGFRRDMPAVFAACDLLIHPARYEAYGLAVHEALCRGLPALVTRDGRRRRAVSRGSRPAPAAGSRRARPSWPRVCRPGARTMASPDASPNSPRGSAPAPGIIWRGRSWN